MSLLKKTILFFFFFPHLSLHATPANTLEVQKHISKDINQLIRQYDDYGFAIVKITPVVENIEIPASPITVSSIKLSDDKGLIQLKSVELQLYTQYKTIPGTLKSLIESTVSTYGVTPTMTTHILDVAKLQEPSFVKKSPPIEISWVAFAFTLFALSSGFIGYLLLSRKNETESKAGGDSEVLKSAFETGMNQVSNAIQAVGTSLAKAQESGDSFTSDFELQQESQQISSLSTASLRLLFYDCYWCHQDSYAAFLWSKTSADTKTSILSDELLKSYIQNISTLRPTRLSFHKDAYYEEGLSTEGLSQLDLSELVKSHPGLYKQISPMRKSYLVLSPLEKIKLENTETKTFDSNILQSKPSPKRELKAPVQLQIHSIQDEEELLEEEISDLHYIKALPSLIWAHQLSAEEMTQILQGFSAMELATCWVGPSKTLTWLEGLLPAKKVDLLKSYLEKSKPTRSSQSLELIHGAIVYSLELQKGQSDESAQAA